MCGINALIDFRGCLPDRRLRVAAMNAQMVYRGPDGEGLYADAEVALGMRRLSIIDVEGGDQPLFNEDRTLVLVCNGEIYNYKELMGELTSRGHTFTSHSDVECILHLYEEFGEACLEKLRGMFAFVLWDRRHRRVFAARDRVGIKPLYLGQQNGALWLSSELKAIVRAAGISPTLRPASVYQFLRYCYPLDPRHTPIEEVTRLLPGEYLVADAAGMQLRRYWKPSYGGPDGLRDRSDGELLETLESAVDLHLRSDVPVGVLLSAGIDSSTLAVLASRRVSSLAALSAGYKGRHAVDERREARNTATRLGMAFIDIECDVAQFGSHFEAFTRCCDEPVGDIAAMAQWAIYQQARGRGYKVLLSGLGGDELMFGYPRWNSLGQSLGDHPGDTRAHARIIADAFDANLGHLPPGLLAGPLAGATEEALLPFCQLLDQVPRGPDELTAVLFEGYLVHNGCQLSDKLGMGASVEVRVPFLDHQLVEDVFALPLARRFQPGSNKPLLRRLMRGLLPDALLDGPKQGFAPPPSFIDHMVKDQEGLLHEGQLARAGWLDIPTLRAMTRKNKSLPWISYSPIRRKLGLSGSSWLQFRLLAFEKWHQALLEPLRSPATLDGPAL